MSDDSRAASLAKILRANRACKVAGDIIQQRLEALGEAPVPPLSGANPAEAFLTNVLANQGSIAGAANRSEAVKVIASFLFDNYRTQKLVAGSDPRLAALPWRDGRLLPRFEPAENGELVALSYARLGVAETGAVVTYTGRHNPASNNLLPEAQIVLLDQQDLVVTMEQAWDRIDEDMRARGRPRGVNFISAPSSTADVGLKLVKGAHGPRCWHVVLVGEDADSAIRALRQSAV